MIILMKRFLHPFLGLLIFYAAGAQAFDSATFLTEHDSFRIQNSGSRYTLDGKPISKNLIEQWLPLLQAPLRDPCPEVKNKPDLQVRIKNAGKTETRRFFIERHLVKSKDRCLIATGEGLYFLPLHRRWLVGPFSDQVTLNSPFVLSNSRGELVHLVQKGGEWYDNKANTELDWDFFQRFQEALDDFTIRYLVMSQIAIGKPQVTMQSGKDHYLLVQLSPNTWGIQKPGEKTLEVSSDWNFWYNLDQGVWLDQHSDAIRKAEDVNANKEAKLAAMHTLESSWSRSIQEFFQRRLLDQNEDPEVRLAALARLKTKPSLSNLKTYVEVLKHEPSDNLLSVTTLALHEQDPKGPIFQSNGSNRAEVIRVWLAWWNEHRDKLNQ